MRARALYPTRRQALLATVGWPLLARGQAPTGDFWHLAREGGCVLLMRHAATEPGTGDPPGFRLGHCATQRNLSAAGRHDARAVGERFVREGVKLSQVRSSAWCRCLDTARIAFGDDAPQVWPALNSFFQGQGNGEAQGREVLHATLSLRPPDNWLLVTHQVNITQLTGIHPAMGDILLTRPQATPEPRLRVLARWRP